MTRLFLLTLLLLLTATPAMASSEESALTGKTLIEGNVVTVGDLFTNAGRNAAHVLAPAPAVGKQLVLSNADLQRVAKAFHLQWTPSDNTTLVTLQRDASAVDSDQIVEALRNSDLQGQISSDAQFKLNNFSAPVIVNGHEKPELVVSGTRFNEMDESFSATVQIKRADVVLKEITVEGIATTMVQVPVLKYVLMSNSQILAGYLTEISVPKSKMRGDAILSKAELIGMTTRRGLQANQMISQADVNPPILVKRNELVTVTYRNGPVVLSAKARALGNGIKGDNLMFMNTTSKKPFEAKVTGPQQAEVNLDG